ncbi:MAG: DUF4350 domain-containing protein [Verrucomicrobiota bacterium]
MLFAILTLTGCEYREVKRETGFKGRARVNPWLAAERFCEAYPGQVRSLAGWTEPTMADAVWFVPGSLLGNGSFTRRLSAWVTDGGHLVVMLDHAETAHDDWKPFAASFPPDPALKEMLEDFGLRLVSAEDGEKAHRAETLEFGGKNFLVEMKSDNGVTNGDGAPVSFVSMERDAGRLSVVADGRIFRNRWIGKKQHAEFLDALIRASGREGNIGFTRGDGLSLWSLASEHLWPVLLGLGLFVILWLWKNLSRFGPMEAAQVPSMLRGYEHHLGALGDFQWRLDKAAGMLAPLRQQILERGQRACQQRINHGDADLFTYLAEISDLPRERVQQALAETSPRDAAILTRTAADLQRLQQILY